MPQSVLENTVAELLCFAHRGEAQEFLRQLPFVAHPEFRDFWLDSTGARYLLLTGEGIENSMARLGFILGRFPQIKLVTNIGVAGALRSIEVGDVLDIRSVYAQDRFQSFELPGDYDIITAQARVLDDEQREKLSAFAPIVDRELWGLVFSAKEAQRPIRALKVISDKPGQIQGRELCARVKEEAPALSKLLFEAYQKRSVPRHEEAEENDERLTEHDPLGALLNPRFHFSQTQKRQYTKLCELLDPASVETLAKSLEELFCEDEQRPKDRARSLLARLEELASPYEAKVRSRLEQLRERAQKRGINLSFDSKLEELEARVNVTITPETNLQNLSEEVLNLPLTEAWSLLRGQQDV
jgi:hypothetical protein